MRRAGQRYVILTLAFFLFVCIYLSLSRDPIADPDLFGPHRSSSSSSYIASQNGPSGDHPIDLLIREARSSFKQVLSKRSLTLAQAAERYRERRGRHPPPGFDAWFAAAKARDAVVVEDFFDRIHHDLNPLWALSPRDLRLRAHGQPERIQVRGGRVDFVTQRPNVLTTWQLFLDWLMPQYRRPLKIQLWTELVQEMMPHLPDLDMPVNVMDETRILVPFETMEEYMEKERKTRNMPDPKNTIDTYSGLDDIDHDKRNSKLAFLEEFDPGYITEEVHQYWDHLRAACPLGSPARPNSTSLKNSVSSLKSHKVPVEYPTSPVGAYTYQGFVRNFSASQDPCLQPHLRGMHGTFIESVSMSTSHKLFPLFAETKIRQNNEILIPAAAYLTKQTMYSGGEGHGGSWKTKINGLIWRGVASGGRNKADNWWHFHRHRWVQMMNGSTVSAVEAGGGRKVAPTFDLVSADIYPELSHRREGQIGEWLSTFSDVGFVDLVCWPEVPVKGSKKEARVWEKTCAHTSPYFELAKSMPMKQQYNYKYIPDVDGNSFSGRWRGFLASTSMPLKSTIYTEWHDERIIPWVHFVPFDTSYMDIYGIMDYFLNGHDEEARQIAEDGKLWAEKVYRREDMVLYVWRLLLEYARVVDDNREKMAFVGDLR